MPLINIELHLLVRFVEFARFASGLQFSDHLFEHLHHLHTAFALETLQVKFHATVRSNRNFELALRHKSKLFSRPSDGPSAGWPDSRPPLPRPRRTVALESRPLIVDGHISARPAGSIPDPTHAVPPR